MASLLAVDDLIEVNIYTAVDTHYSTNVMHYHVSAVGGAALTDAAVMAAREAVYAPLLKAIMSNEAEYLGSKWQVVGPARRPAVTTTAGNGAGTLASDVLPTQTCGLLKVLSNVSGRSNQGRMYLPYPAEVSNDAAGDPTNAYLVDAFAYSQSLFDTSYTITVGANSATIIPVVYSRLLNTQRNVVSANAETQWATLMRRAARRDRGNPPV